MEITEQQILEALRVVQDPDLHRNIVELGFVKNIKVCGGVISFDVELTTPACPVKEKLKAEATEAVKNLPGVEQVTVKMTSQVTQGAGGSTDLLKSVKNVVAVGSGKGGVGKSTVSVGLAIALAQEGARVGLMDLDCWGPNIPLMMGIDPAVEKPRAVEKKLIPYDRYGVKVMSIGVLLSKPDEAVIWRGPMVHHLIRQFCQDVEWGELDYMIVDLPPGTGDVQLSLAQQAPLTGAVVVSTPQDVALMDATRAITMFRKVKVPILGIVENMSLFECPHCGKVVELFGHGGAEKAADRMEIPFMGAIPLDVDIRIGGDQGNPILTQKPESASAERIREVARNVAARVSTINSMRAEEVRFGAPIAWGKAK